MNQTDRRPKHLGWIETALRADNPDLPHLEISAQSHYGPPDHVAFIDVYGVDDDTMRRRQIRSQAGDQLRRLGYTVELEPGRDVFDIAPVRPASAHERLRMLGDLRAARGPGD